VATKWSHHPTSSGIEFYAHFRNLIIQSLKDIILLYPRQSVVGNLFTPPTAAGGGSLYWLLYYIIVSPAICRGKPLYAAYGGGGLFILIVILYYCIPGNLSWETSLRRLRGGSLYWLLYYIIVLLAICRGKPLYAAYGGGGHCVASVFILIVILYYCIPAHPVGKWPFYWSTTMEWDILQYSHTFYETYNTIFGRHYIIFVFGGHEVVTPSDFKRNWVLRTFYETYNTIFERHYIIVLLAICRGKLFTPPPAAGGTV
jgi:hypothetical protein